MAIPISIEKLIETNIVEYARIEYKKSWNPEPILRTICAFANDIDNWGGGYIIVGLEEQDGVPICPPSGIEADSLDWIMKELLNLSKMIKPGYLPICEPTVYQGKHLLLIWVPGGHDRPYDCPEKPFLKNSKRAFYIRKMSSTIKASRRDIQELHDIGSNIPFDDRPNIRAQVSDLKLQLIRSYLTAIDSNLLPNMDNQSLKELVSDLHLIDGPSEQLKPLNVGLMFFNYNPDLFFRYAWIEVVQIPDPTGTNMVEKTFKGPLNDQLTQALQYIQNFILAEKIIKLPDQAEAARKYNYPFRAVEELLSNAVFHRSYQIPEPIEVRVTANSMQITSFPGPERSITDEDIQRGELRGRRYRNRRIGEFLKELDLIEGRNTGIPNVASALKANGSEAAIYETDSERSYFTATLKIHPQFITTENEALDKKQSSKRRSRAEIEEAIIVELQNVHSCSTNELSQRLGYKAISKTLSEVIDDMIKRNLIEYTDPNIKTSPNQNLRLKESEI